MIIHRYWVTKKERCQPRRGKYHTPFPGMKYEIMKWRGWFLFGIIPLYIHCTGITYERT